MRTRAPRWQGGRECAVRWSERRVWRMVCYSEARERAAKRKGAGAMNRPANDAKTVPPFGCDFWGKRTQWTNEAHRRNTNRRRHKEQQTRAAALHRFRSDADMGDAERVEPFDALPIALGETALLRRSPSLFLLLHTLSLFHPLHPSPSPSSSSLSHHCIILTFRMNQIELEMCVCVGEKEHKRHARTCPSLQDAVRAACVGPRDSSVRW